MILTSDEVKIISSTLSALTNWHEDNFSACVRSRFLSLINTGDIEISFMKGESSLIKNALDGMVSQPVVGPICKSLAERFSLS